MRLRLIAPYAVSAFAGMAVWGDGRRQAVLQVRRGSLRTRLKAFVHHKAGEMADGEAPAVPGVALDPA